jgi:hypothetical protein
LEVSLILEIKKPIKVAVVFTNENFPKPGWFIYNNEKIMLKEVCYKWTERQGKWLNYKYTVTDGSSIFEIVFFTEKMLWRLEMLDDSVYN